ncbi:putative N-acetyltransferase (chloroplast) [Galdieria partita]|uniref:N-acetyltransferase n=1 Tax=Galdieria partita TaxID=83374 RepID=A0A9C7BRB2_9RHOD|nr:putative N-acetyltransferase [Galdieria partita]
MLDDTTLIIKSIPFSNKEIKVLFKRNTILDIKDLILLYKSVGWQKNSVNKLQRLIKNNLLISCFIELSTIKPNLIGFVLASSDCEYYSIIWDLMINPKFQNLGLGKELMSLIIHETKKMRINNTILFADDEVINFYKKLGFVIEPNKTKVLFLSN